MELERARYLVSPDGRAALESLPADLPVNKPNQLAAQLRRSFPPAEASALAEQVTLRVRAKRNHGSERPFLYTRSGLEMMTHPIVAARRAERLANLSLPLADLTCGLGGDLAAAAAAGVAAFGFDHDLVHVVLAAANTGAPVARADAIFPAIDLKNFAVLLDPSRREGAGRRFDPARFSPPWDRVLTIAAEASAAVVKAPPGLDHAAIPATAELEAVQLDGSLRELTLWLGGSASPGLRRAVLLPAGETLESTEPAADAHSQPAGQFLYDPESCVTRSTLVLQLAYRLRASLIDPHLAYLTSLSPAFSPLAATFEVLDALPFSVGRLKDRLRAGHWRPDEIRRRAFPIEPDELRKLLGKLEGDPVTLLLTTIADRRTVFICRRLFAPA